MKERNEMVEYRQKTLTLPSKPKTYPRLPREKPWSHQTELALLRGKQIEIQTDIDLVWRRYTLLEADAFAVKVVGCDVDNDKSILTYYKHAIRGYRAAQ